jgi:DNA-binding transcriptional LysR family regulator
MLPPGLDIRLLESLIALVTESSVTRAAERMSMTQPRMSNVLARLRRLIGDPLLVRSGRQMTPTARALEIAQAVQESLLILNGALAEPAGFDPSRESRVFVLAMSDYVSVMLMPAIMAEIERTGAKAVVHIKAIEPTLVNRWLDDEECDLAFGFLTHLNPRTRATVLLHDDAVCIAREGHPAVEGRISLESYIGLGHVITSGTPAPVSTLEQIVDATLAELGMVRPVATKVTSGLALAGTVARSDLIATLPRRAAEAYRRALPLQVVELPMRVTPFDIMMVWHERAHRHPAYAWLRKLIRTAVRREIAMG